MEIVFDDAFQEYTCFTCDHVLNKELPILMVAHDHDGDWQFLCGIQGHTADNAKVIDFLEALILDPSLTELETLPKGHQALRASPGDAWHIMQIKG